MAGPAPSTPDDAYQYDAFDLASTPAEYRQIKTAMENIKEKIGKRLLKVTLGIKGDVKPSYQLLIAGPQGADKKPEEELPLKNFEKKEELDALKEEINKRGVRVGDIKIDVPEAKTAWVRSVKVIPEDPKRWLEFYEKYLRETVTLRTVEDEIKEKTGKEREIGLKALSLLDPNKIRYKPYGRLSTW